MTKKYPINCRHFNGYKPCGLSENCSNSCSYYQPEATQILVIHLGAIGAVVRTSALLKPIRRKYPNSKIYWMTSNHIVPLLKNNPLIDRVCDDSWKSILSLSNLNFDVVMNVEKSTQACGILNFLKYDHLKGFYANSVGKILTADKDSEYYWENGLSNKIKFFINKKSEIEMITEALGLDYQRDPYFLPLDKGENLLKQERKYKWSDGGKNIIIGINTGCSPTIPYKKISDKNLEELIRSLKLVMRTNIVLLGGPEDKKRNHYLANKYKIKDSPCDLGLRDGMCSVAACDVVVSADSLGMHMAIAQKVYTVAWFGPTCSHEIDLYDNGDKVVSNFSCSPCWKRNCDKKIKCSDQVDVCRIVSLVKDFIDSKLPILQASDIQK